MARSDADTPVEVAGRKSSEAPQNAIFEPLQMAQGWGRRHVEVRGVGVRVSLRGLGSEPILLSPNLPGLKQRIKKAAADVFRVARNSSGILLPLSSLHSLQAQTRFTVLFVPPRHSGIQWSTVSPGAPQYQHVSESRAKIMARTWRGIFQRLCDRSCRISGGFHLAKLPEKACAWGGRQERQETSASERLNRLARTSRVDDTPELQKISEIESWLGIASRAAGAS